MQVTTWLVLQWRWCFLSLCERARIKTAVFLCVILKMKLTFQSPTYRDWNASHFSSFYPAPICTHFSWHTFWWKHSPNARLPFIHFQKSLWKDGWTKKPQTLGAPEDLKEYLKPGQTGLCFSPVQVRDYYQHDCQNTTRKQTSVTAWLADSSAWRQLAQISSPCQGTVRTKTTHSIHTRLILHISFCKSTCFQSQTSHQSSSFKCSLFHECVSLALTQSEYTKRLYYSPFLQHHLKWDCLRKQNQFKFKERRGTKCLLLIAVQTGNKTS